MSVIFMNSDNSKTYDAHRVRLHLKNIIDLRRGNNRGHYQTFISSAHGRI